MSPLLAIQAELERAYAASDSYLALARRVHAECGPSLLCDRAGEFCPCCLETVDLKTKLTHKPDCLWLAAEAVLVKSGEGKP